MITRETGLIVFHINIHWKGIFNPKLIKLNIFKLHGKNLCRETLKKVRR